MKCRKIRYSLLIFFLINSSPLLFAQNASIPYNRSIDKLILSQWTTKEGLNTNKIIDVKQTFDNYLWLSTYDGLLRFDGVKFELYNSNNRPEMLQDTYYEIFEGQDSTLWFLTRGEGVLKYKNGSFSFLDLKNVLPKNIRTIYLDSKDRLWVVGFEEVYCVDNGIVNKIEHDALSDGQVLKVCEDSNGNIYFGLDGTGVIKFDGDIYRHIAIEDNVIISMAKGLNGDIIVGTFNGISIIDNQEIVRRINFSKGARVNDILVDKDENIFLGTDIGLFRINEKDNVYEKLLEGDKLPTREINDLEIDHEGSIWLAMERGGLIQLKQGKLSSYTRNEGLSLDRINIIEEKEKGVFWVGSDNGEIDIINTNDNHIEKISPKNSLENRGIRDFLFDGDNIWIASYNGLLKIRGNEEINYTENEGLSSNLIRRIIKDKFGNIWIATRSGGVNKIDKTGSIEIFDTKRGLPSNYILSLLEDDGDIYVGANRGGVSIIRKNGKIDLIEDSSGSNDLDAVNFNIRKDAEERIWVTAGNGIFLLENNRLKELEVKSNIGTRSFFDIIDDKNGAFWLTTSKGLVRISKMEVESFLKGNIPYVNFELFDDNDGLPSSECTAATKSLLDSNGNIWIPTNSGVGVLNPKGIINNKIIPSVYVQFLKVDDEDYDLTNIQIKPGHTRYKIGFTALSYLAPLNNQYKYKLIGLDEEWNQPDMVERTIEYTNLEPGDYQFKVIASNNDGIWNEEGASIKFVVEPYVYQTLWFKVLIFLSVVVSFLMYSRWRIERIDKRNRELRKLNQELDSFVYSTSHDLRAPLASVLGLLNVAKLDDNIDQKNRYMGMMEESVKKLDGFIQDIINYSRNSRLAVEAVSFDLKALIDDLLNELKYIDTDNSIKKSINISGNPIVKSDIHRIKIVLNNLISNALKYRDVNKKDSYFRIDINISNDEIDLNLEDNGIGIPKEHIAHIFEMFYRATEKSKGSGIGLYIVKEALLKLNGTITVNSTLGQKTLFTVKIPLTTP